LNKYWRPISRHEWVWGLSDNDIDNAIKMAATDMPKDLYKYWRNEIWEPEGPIVRY